eukprot:scaffold34462_cov56-Phaeocystis_antarctica.AAC.3
MYRMVVTLEVLTLSGWLNADAPCGESKGGHAVRSEEYQSAGGRGGGHRTTAAHAACRGVLDCRLGAGHGEERTCNMPYMAVALEVSKLSGWLNADAYCRVERRAYGAGRASTDGMGAGHGGGEERT